MAKRRKQKINMSKVRGLIYVCFSIGLILSLIYKFNNIIVKQNETITSLTAQKKDLEKQKSDLSEQLDSLDNEDYVTTYAREKYIFKSDDETVAKISSDEDLSSENDN